MALSDPTIGKIIWIRHTLNDMPTTQKCLVLIASLLPRLLSVGITGKNHYAWLQSSVNVPSNTFLIPLLTSIRALLVFSKSLPISPLEYCLVPVLMLSYT